MVLVTNIGGSKANEALNPLAPELYSHNFSGIVRFDISACHRIFIDSLMLVRSRAAGFS